MTMKRRGFLQLLGGALAAPLMPSASLGAASKAAYPASALHAAIYHAQSRVNFSVFALAQKLGLDLGQAEQLMSDMSTRGILGPMQGSTQAGRWARSKVWTHPIVNAQTAREATKAKRDTPQTRTDVRTYKEPDLGAFLIHLRKIAVDQGFTLHPRCFEAA
ncbi:hypothetical protein L0664_11490 [Octadecabacter sp. G9-8]|uniref:Uncharacterized protein n=1 Tax=Octadecabacter dasysiphoniae TaxID=2909341 RepID=A0ABS9CWS2_9RHOB|nr:hypothetical protein [Octadecabacter dasysiphoniae]MCF2871690.1 hypothetical protein [Octadecabacter dasysiphoniae]